MNAGHATNNNKSASYLKPNHVFEELCKFKSTDEVSETLPQVFVCDTFVQGTRYLVS